MSGGGEWFKRRSEDGSFRHLGWLLLGVVAFLIGTVMQAMPAKYPELTALLEACEKAPQECRTAVLAFDVSGHRASALSYLALIADLLRSIGASVVVSIFIIFTVEARNRKEFEGIVAGKARELSLSVFHGMFNRNHPTALLDTVKQHILERDLIRDHLDVMYTLSCVDDCEGREGEKFIQVDVILSSVTRNVSTLHGDAGRAEMPLALLLPNPQVPGLKDRVVVSRFVVNQEDRTTEEIATANRALQAALIDDENNDAVVDFGKRFLEAGESVSLSATYTMIKEQEDTEVFRSLQICRSISLTVVDRTGLDLHIQAKGIHPSKLESISASASTKQWRLSDIILPQQGIMVFWKRRRPSRGTPSPSPDA